jgi:hypothetical protein
LQVFLPYPDLQDSVVCLDPKRLGNQVYRECKTLVGGGWARHPASIMWRPYKAALISYALFGLDELERRGLSYPQHRAFFESLLPQPDVSPPWLGDERLHRSHRSALLRKDPEWYSQFGWSEPTDLPYFWPRPQA